MERARRRDDAQLVIEHDEGLANSGDDAVEVGAGRLDFLFGRFHLGNAGKRDDDPLNAAVVASIGQHRSHEPAAVVGPHFPPDRRVAGQHRARIRQQILVLEPARYVGKRPADIGSDEAEERACGWREEANAQLGIQKKRRHVRADEDALKVAERRALPLDRLMQLDIEGRELRIEGPQLLLRCRLPVSRRFRQAALVRLRPSPAGLCTASCHCGGFREPRFPSRERSRASAHPITTAAPARPKAWYGLCRAIERTCSRAIEALSGLGIFRSSQRSPFRVPMRRAA